MIWKQKDRMGGDIHYYVSSRAKTPNDLKINTRNEKPDGVIIYSLYGEKKTGLCWYASTVIRWMIMFMNCHPGW